MGQLTKVMLFAFFFMLPIVSAQYSLPYDYYGTPSFSTFFSPSQWLQNEWFRFTLLSLFFFALSYYGLRIVFREKVYVGGKPTGETRFHKGTAVAVAAVISIFLASATMSYFDVLIGEKIILYIVLLVALLGVIAIALFFKKVGAGGIGWISLAYVLLYYFYKYTRIIPYSWKAEVPRSVTKFLDAIWLPAILVTLVLGGAIIAGGKKGIKEKAAKVLKLGEQTAGR